MLKLTLVPKYFLYDKFFISKKYSILRFAHCSVVRDLKDNDDDDDESENEKESDDKGSELSSDSELSLGDEPLMEIQVSLDICLIDNLNNISHVYLF